MFLYLMETILYIMYAFIALFSDVGLWDLFLCGINKIQ